MKLGLELDRLGAPDDPVEGSNVTLVCSTFNNYASPTPPPWSYQTNTSGEEMQIIDENDPPPGMKTYTIIKKDVSFCYSIHQAFEWKRQSMCSTKSELMK